VFKRARTKNMVSRLDISEILSDDQQKLLQIIDIIACPLEASGNYKRCTLPVTYHFSLDAAVAI